MVILCGIVWVPRLLYASLSALLNVDVLISLRSLRFAYLITTSKSVTLGLSLQVLSGGEGVVGRTVFVGGGMIGGGGGVGREGGEGDGGGLYGEDSTVIVFGEEDGGMDDNGGSDCPPKTEGSVEISEPSERDLTANG